MNVMGYLKNEDSLQTSGRKYVVRSSGTAAALVDAADLLTHWKLLRLFQNLTSAKAHQSTYPRWRTLIWLLLLSRLLHLIEKV